MWEGEICGGKDRCFSMATNEEINHLIAQFIFQKKKKKLATYSWFPYIWRAHWSYDFLYGRMWSCNSNTKMLLFNFSSLYLIINFQPKYNLWISRSSMFLCLLWYCNIDVEIVRISVLTGWMVHYICTGGWVVGQAENCDVSLINIFITYTCGPRCCEKLLTDNCLFVWLYRLIIYTQNVPQQWSEITS